MSNNNGVMLGTHRLTAPIQHCNFTQYVLVDSERTTQFDVNATTRTILRNIHRCGVGSGSDNPGLDKREWAGDRNPLRPVRGF